MSDIQIFPSEMDGLSRGLESGTDSLDTMDTAPVANAGESIALVAQAVGRLAQASSGISAGLHQSARDVRAAKDEYLRSDNTSADRLRQAGEH